MSDQKQPLPWPDKDALKEQYGRGSFEELYWVAHFNNARADAAMSRLRILQRAALRFLASDIAKRHEDYGSVDCIAEALDAIGPLPLTDKEAG